MKKEWLKLIEKRRSIYNLGRRKVLSEDEVEELVRGAVKYCPSAFNSQSGRVVILFGEESQKFWKLTFEELKKSAPVETWDNAERKIVGFAAGMGTILYFEDTNIVKGLQKKFPLYADNFPKWSLQSNGMLEYIVWMALEAEGMGASLQHYNPLVDNAVKKEWKLPESWELLAQMPFGSIEVSAGEKTFEPLEERIKVFK